MGQMATLVEGGGSSTAAGLKQAWADMVGMQHT